MRSTILLLLTVAVADPKPGEQPAGGGRGGGPPDSEKAAELVKQLGHPRFTVREAAAKQLLEMGEAAIPALTAGTKATDEEVRTRSAALLPKVRAGVWKKWADAYLADPDGKLKQDLPLRPEFEKLTGEPTPGSRKLFAEMIRTNGELLQVTAATPGAAPAALRARCRTLNESLQAAGKPVPGQVGDLAAVFFVGANVPAAKADWKSTDDAALLLANPALGEAMRAEDVGPAMRKIMVRWAETRPGDDIVSHQFFALAVRKQPFAEAIPVLTRLAKDKKASPLNVRALAIEALGKIGDADARAALEGLVTDPTSLFQGVADRDYPVGDCAFAALVGAHKKDPSDYGLDGGLRIAFRSAPGAEMVQLNLRTFPSNDARQKALKKWKDEAKKK